tara:strand:- start:1191 stop:1865 length:675 start_codon:yes stop_codon:yes gene_type:complete
MNVYVLNLDSAKDRWEAYEGKGFNRWKATHYDDLADDHPIFADMVSMWNCPPLEHNAKCACYMTHVSLWEHIVKHDLKNVLVLEDDAHQVGDLPDPEDLPKGNSLTYLGGITYNNRLTDGPKPMEFKEGINEIIKADFRMIMLLSYFIPNRRVAYKLLQSVRERGRPRAIDTMVRDAYVSQYLYYPAVFVEKPIQSQIRNKKTKFSNKYYHSVTKKQGLLEINS